MVPSKIAAVASDDETFLTGTATRSNPSSAASGITPPGTKAGARSPPERRASHAPRIHSARFPLPATASIRAKNSASAFSKYVCIPILQDIPKDQNDRKSYIPTCTGIYKFSREARGRGSTALLRGAIFPPPPPRSRPPGPLDLGGCDHGHDHRLGLFLIIINGLRLLAPRLPIWSARLAFNDFNDLARPDILISAARILVDLHIHGRARSRLPREKLHHSRLDGLACGISAKVISVLECAGFIDALLCVNVLNEGEFFGLL